MHSLFVLPAAIAAFVLVASGRADAGTNAKKIDAIFAHLADAKSPGMAVLVRQDGRTVFARGYGVRDLRTFAKIDAETNFRLASCTKQFTAMAIMLLVHDGKLHYDGKLTSIFPGFPAYGKDITIRNLLNHTSGLPDYESLMDQGAHDGISPWSAQNQIQGAGVLALLEQQKSGKFAPGSRWAYSNSGYVVLGLVIAKISGLPYPEFLRTRIFAPLKMDRTVAYVKGRNEVSQRAYGYAREAAGWEETDQSATSATLGDGGVYTSIDDLAKWDAALAKRTLLSEKEMQPALTPVKLTSGLQPRWPAGSDRPEGTPVSYGFGWFLDSYHGHARMWHYGDTVGFHTYIERFTDDKLTIVVLCNRTDLDPEALAARVADQYFAPAAASPGH